jgi:hypothetical protein
MGGYFLAWSENEESLKNEENKEGGLGKPIIGVFKKKLQACKWYKSNYQARGACNNIHSSLRRSPLKI